MRQGFLPVTRADMEARGWEQVDFVYVSGDAYAVSYTHLDVYKRQAEAVWCMVLLVLCGDLDVYF